MSVFNICYSKHLRMVISCINWMQLCIGTGPRLLLDFFFLLSPFNLQHSFHSRLVGLACHCFPRNLCVWPISFFMSKISICKSLCLTTLRKRSTSHTNMAVLQTLVVTCSGSMMPSWELAENWWARYLFTRIGTAVALFAGMLQWERRNLFISFPALRIKPKWQGWKAGTMLLSHKEK